MAEQMRSEEFESDPTKRWLLSLFAPMCSLACLSFAIYRLGSREDWVGFVIIGGIGGLWLLIFLGSRGHFGVVTVSELEVRVRQNGSEYRFPWRDVKSFRSVPLVNPPIYQLRFEDSTLVTYFVPKTWRFLWFDTGPMAGFIRRRLREVRGLV